MSEPYHHPAGPFDIACPTCGKRATFQLTPDARPNKEPPAYRDGVWHSAGPEWGICQCDHCVSRVQHALQWPKDAYWRTSVRGCDVWAHTRAEIGALLRFVASADRDLAQHPEHAYFLRRFPRELLSAKARDEVVKRLSKLLVERTT